ADLSQSSTTSLSEGEGLRSLQPHRAGLGDLRVARERLIALAVDGVDRNASFGIGVSTPAQALTETGGAQTGLSPGEEFAAGEAKLLLACLRAELTAWR